jgi:Domain of unknown function (DUF1937)
MSEMFDIEKLMLRGSELWYLATPYNSWGGGRTDAFLMAARYAGMLTEMGVPIFSPVCHFHPQARWVPKPEPSDKIYVEANQRFLIRCYGILIITMEGWRNSENIKAELSYFNPALQFHLDPDDLEKYHVEWRRRGGSTGGDASGRVPG